MPCYTIVHITVHDPEKFAEYGRQVPATIEKWGGEYLIRGGHTTVVEGEMPHERHVVGKFPDRATAEGWYNSPEYQEILNIRLAASTGTLIMVDGVEG
ncbi:MAG: DUF1330 domain-containing protein [Pseudomonadota bacterium]